MDWLSWFNSWMDYGQQLMVDRTLAKWGRTEYSW